MDGIKKFISPPEYWQQFEDLCKKLFGEVWGCPHTIKKHGRQGQPQSGVDVYGKPKGSNDYWGIQCKGKDNFLDKKLTEKEIDTEIAKALTFEPALKVFIFATTAAKDVEIEKYVRLKDQESCSKGNFEIILYDWQEISDFLSENRETYNWYMNNIKFKEQFDVEVNIDDGKQEKVVTPKFLKIVTEYKYRHEAPLTSEYFQLNKLDIPWMNTPIPTLFGSGKVNHGWCSFETNIKNTGSKVIEDWKFWLTFPENTIKIDDDAGINLFNYKELSKYRTCFAYDKDKTILYKPLDNSPLIQKDSKHFKCHFIPHFDDKEVVVKWQLLARDFDREGEFKIIVKPEYELKNKKILVETKDEEKTETQIEEFIE